MPFCAVSICFQFRDLGCNQTLPLRQLKAIFYSTPCLSLVPLLSALAHSYQSITSFRLLKINSPLYLTVEKRMWRSEQDFFTVLLLITYLASHLVIMEVHECPCILFDLPCVNKYFGEA